jgi:hypothetical protein
MSLATEQLYGANNDSKHHANPGTCHLERPDQSSSNSIAEYPKVSRHAAGHLSSFRESSRHSIFLPKIIEPSAQQQQKSLKLLSVIH